MSGKRDALPRYAVIGNPVAHSKSPEIHAHFAAQTGQTISYERMLAPVGGFAQTVRGFVKEGASGANVTVPFKLEAYTLADELSERARAAEAVNTLSFVDGRIIGDNTDGVGLVADIVDNAGYPLAGKRILLLGAGGAARGVMLPMLSQLPVEVVIANRTPAKAAELAAHFSRSSVPVRAAAFDDLRETFDIVINATSASLSSEAPAIPPSVFTPQTFAYDMMYGKGATPFMRLAQAHGAQTRDGLGMLVEQAAESFFIWRGVHPDTAPIYAQLRAGL